VIASIRQPSTSVFELFDKVTFLSPGLTVYFGSPEKIVLFVCYIIYVIFL
jgi:hypothetical protein